MSLQHCTNVRVCYSVIRMQLHFMLLILSIIVPRSAFFAITFIRRVCITAVYTVSNVADDDANSYIYYTFIILHYTVNIFSSHASLHSYTPRALSLLSPCRIFAVSVACPCSQSAWATTASPAPLPGRVVVGRRSHSSDHHTPIPSRFWHWVR